MTLRPKSSNGDSGDNDNNELFRLLVEGVQEYAIFVLDPEGRIATWNMGAERIKGYRADEIIGQEYGTFFTPEDRAAGKPQHILQTAVREGSVTDEGWRVRKDSSRFWASATVTALWENTGEDGDERILRGFAKVTRDLTERKRREDELQAAVDKQSRMTDTLQHSFLMVPPPDAFPGITVKPLYQSASDDALIGGDFFDLFAVEENKIALVVGDATGKGLEAATYTAEAKFALRAYLRESPSPADALRRLNVFVTARERLDPLHLGGSYIAIAVSVVDTRANHLVCAWAGIEPPFILRAEGGEALELMECNGPLLGIDAASEYCEERVSLRPGDIVAMSTDGLTEARRSRGRIREFFGYDGLVRAVREEVARHPSSLGDVGMAVAQRAREFAGGTINDDVCLLLARCISQGEPGEPGEQQGEPGEQGEPQGNE